MASVKWATFAATATTVINGNDTTPTAKNLSAAAQKCGNEIDNTSNLYLYADFEMYCRTADTAHAGDYIALYLIEALDGTNYADGADDSTTPPATAWVGNFPLRAVSTQQRVTLRGVLLGPGKYKPVIINNSAHGLTNTDGENILTYRAYFETVA